MISAAKLYRYSRVFAYIKQLRDQRNDVVLSKYYSKRSNITHNNECTTFPQGKWDWFSKTTPLVTYIFESSEITCFSTLLLALIHQHMSVSPYSFEVKWNVWLTLLAMWTYQPNPCIYKYCVSYVTKYSVSYVKLLQLKGVKNIGCITSYKSSKSYCIVLMHATSSIK